MIYFSETTSASNLQIYYNISLKRLYISTGNDVIVYFQSATKPIRVFVLGRVRVAISDNGSIDFEKVDSFGNSDLSGLFSIV